MNTKSPQKWSSTFVMNSKEVFKTLLITENKIQQQLNSLLLLPLSEWDSERRNTIFMRLTIMFCLYEFPFEQKNACFSFCITLCLQFHFITLFSRWAFKCNLFSVHVHDICLNYKWSRSKCVFLVFFPLFLSFLFISILKHV